MFYVAQVEKNMSAQAKLKDLLQKYFINIVCQDGNNWVMYVMNSASIEVDTYYVSDGPTFEDCILNCKL